MWNIYACAQWAPEIGPRSVAIPIYAEVLEHTIYSIFNIDTSYLHSTQIEMVCAFKWACKHCRTSEACNEGICIIA